MSSVRPQLSCKGFCQVSSYVDTLRSSPLSDTKLSNQRLAIWFHPETFRWASDNCDETSMLWTHLQNKVASLQKLYCWFSNAQLAMLVTKFAGKIMSSLLTQTKGCFSELSQGMSSWEFSKPWKRHLLLRKSYLVAIGMNQSSVDQTCICSGFQ